jgi:hypothetical protein
VQGRGTLVALWWLCIGIAGWPSQQYQGLQPYDIERAQQRGQVVTALLAAHRIQAHHAAPGQHGGRLGRLDLAGLPRRVVASDTAVASGVVVVPPIPVQALPAGGGDVAVGIWADGMPPGDDPGLARPHQQPVHALDTTISLADGAQGEAQQPGACQGVSTIVEASVATCSCTHLHSVHDL